MFVGLDEVAADLRRDAESVEEICGDDADENLLREIAGEIRWAWVVVQGDEAVEGLIPGAIVEEVGWRDVGEIAEGEFAVEPNEAVCIRERERAEDDGIDDAEDGGVGADAERECQDRDDGKGRIFAESAEGVAEILGEVVEECGDWTLVARGVMDEGDVAEFAVGGFVGMSW